MESEPSLDVILIESAESRIGMQRISRAIPHTGIDLYVHSALRAYTTTIHDVAFRVNKSRNSKFIAGYPYQNRILCFCYYSPNKGIFQYISFAFAMYRK